MLLPGPEAHQLAVYIGWLMHRTRGGIVAGTLFVLPGLICLGVLSWIYAAFGDYRHRAGTVFRSEGGGAGDRARSGRAGRPACAEESGDGRARRHSPLSAFSFLACRSRSLLPRLRLIGFVEMRAGLEWFRASGGHGPAASGAEGRAAIDEAFAREIPEHVRPSIARLVKVAVIGLVVWLVPLLVLLADARPRQRLHDDRCASMPRWRSSPLAALTPCSPIWRSKQSRLTTG